MGFESWWLVGIGMFLVFVAFVLATWSAVRAQRCMDNLMDRFSVCSECGHVKIMHSPNYGGNCTWSDCCCKEFKEDWPDAV